MAVRSRAYKSHWLIAPALIASTIAQGAGVLTYEATRPKPRPTLTLRLSGEGSGQILATRPGQDAPVMRCVSVEGKEKRCSVEVDPGTEVHLAATLGEHSTFGGYQQYPERTPKELVPLLGDPVALCNAGDAVEAATHGDVLQCPIKIVADTDIAIEFGATPDEVKLDLPVADAEPPKPEPKADPTPPPPKPIDAEKLESPTTVALVTPEEIKKLPPPVPPPPPPPEQQQEKPKTPPPPPPPNMVMVEVKDDKHVVDKEPDDATKLSDKNRDVDEETRAKETNLEKESDGQQVASRESDDKTSEQVGGPDDKIRQNEETNPDTDRAKETDHSGDAETAKNVQGTQGDNGDEGAGDKDPGLLAMRGIAGRGSVVDQPDGKKLGKKGLPGVNTPLQTTDYERLMGKDKAEEERQIAARRASSKKGRWEKKLDAIKSSLENFVPDVRPGNQTALKTRAHPYALYIARMHRRIHELWGFGFLEQLDSRPANDPLNNVDLWVNLEISVNKDGTLHKVTIAKTSGKTEFDVAAVDTVISAGPFEETPEAIRSVDGRIYLRWGFYRNWRQCGTFNAEPYILTSVPEGNDVGVLDGPDSQKPGKQPRITPKNHPIGEGTVTPDDGKANDKVSPSTSVTDKQAVFAANLWISGFATATVDKMVKMSTVPFYAGGKVAAETTGDLKDMYGNLVVESGAMKEWKLLKPSEYAGGSKLPDGNVIVQVTATNATFAVVMTRTASGEYRATQLAR